MSPRFRTSPSLRRGLGPSLPEHRQGGSGPCALYRRELFRDSEREWPTRTRQRAWLERESADRLKIPASSEHEPPLRTPATPGVRRTYPPAPTEGKTTRLHCSVTPNAQRARRAHDSRVDRHSRRPFRTPGHAPGGRRPPHSEHLAIPPPTEVTRLQIPGVGAAMMAAEPRTPAGQPQAGSRKPRTSSAPLDACARRARTSAAEWRTVVVQLRSYRNTHGDNNS